MYRRNFNATLLTALSGLIFASSRPANALDITDISNSETTRGLKSALERGAQSAISLLGRNDGFWGNERVRIPLPDALARASDMLRLFGQGANLDELLINMNRAAEAAVPLAKGMLIEAVKNMNVEDAKKILQGGDTSATDFFAEKTQGQLNETFLPVVTQTIQKIGLADKYNQLAGKAADAGLMRKEDANIERYVTAKTMAGLYFMIGEEEKRIRNDPVGTGSALLKKVFGALK